MSHNLIELLLVFGAYIFLFVLVPFWLQGYRLSGERVMDRLVSSLVAGNVIITTLVLLSSLFGIYSRISFILLLIATGVAYRWVFRRESTKNFLKKFARFVDRSKGGYLPTNVLWQSVFTSIANYFKRVVRKIRNPVAFIAVLVMLGFAFYYRSYHAMVNMSYGTSDMYLHTEWITFIDINVPFQGGVYPFGMHATVSALGMVFGFDVVTVMRMLGAITGMLIVFMLYYTLKRVFKSDLAVCVGLLFYCVLNVFNPAAIERQVLALPQEYGMIFLLLTGYYLHDYMKNKNMMSLCCFAGSVAMTMSAHFFVTIYAAVFCAAVFATHLVYMRRDVFVRIVLAVVCSLLIALVPMGISLAKGNKLQDSLYWALGMLEFQQEEAPEDPEAEEQRIREERKEKLSDPIGTLQSAGFFTGEVSGLSCMETEWFVFYVSCAGFGILYPIIKFKYGDRRWMLMGCSLYSLAALGLVLMPYFGYSGIMEQHRMLAFYIYSVPLVIGMPFEFLRDLAHRIGRKTVIAYCALATTIFAALIGYTVKGKHYGFYGRVACMQYDGAVLAYYKMTGEVENNKWTIVSTTDEYSLCLNKGYHYELTDFIIHMNNYDPKDELIIPTDEVFIYIDKRPTDYVVQAVLYDNPQFEPYEKFEPGEERNSLDEYIPRNKGDPLYIYRDYDANRILQAKAYAWAQEYIKYYPREMTVYYEDDEIIVYRLKQNPYALANLAIPYAGNNWGEESRDVNKNITEGESTT